MARPLRRSRRAVSKKETFRPGDVVEVIRGEDVLKGQLVQLLSDGNSENPRWLLKFDDQPYKEAEYGEDAFGKLLVQSTATSDSNYPSDSSSGQRRANGRSSRNSGRTSNPSSDVEKSNGKKTVTFTESNHTSEADEFSTQESAREASSRKDKLSAREARSRRRQAKIDVEVPATNGAVPTDNPKVPEAHNSTGSSAGNVQGSHRKEDIVKFKLSTGTLVFHRGKRRRVEFIRRV